jgi:hypothetical protein
MRVNVQLVDAEGGSHLWAEQFDKPVADYFEMQDEIVMRLSGLQALRLSPRDPIANQWMCGIGAAQLHRGDYENAVKWLRQLVAGQPKPFDSPFLSCRRAGSAWTSKGWSRGDTGWPSAQPDIHDQSLSGWRGKRRSDFP